MPLRSPDPLTLIFLLLTFMATRRRSSATKTAKSASPKTVKESVISVKKVTAKPAKRATRTAKSAVKKEVVVVSNTVTKEKIDECIKAPTRTLKPVTKYQQPAKKKVTEVTPTPEIKETKVSTKSLIEKLRELDGFSLAILPFLYLEGFAKLLLKNQF